MKTKNNSLPLLLVLLIAIGGVWFYQQKRMEEQSRLATLETLGGLRRRLTEFRIKEEERAMKYRGEMIGAGTYLAIALRGQFEKENLEAAYEIWNPLRRDFQAFEKILKDKNSGLLPGWVKEDRNWRELDKEFTK